MLAFFRKQQWLFSFVLIFFLFIVFHFWFERIVYKKITIPIKLVGHKPAGEIHKGRALKQHFFIDRESLEESEGISKEGKICLAVFLATYGKRENVGRVRVALLGEEKRWVKEKSVKEIKDNAFNYFCFDDLTLPEFLKKKDYAFTIETDSPPGKGITAWLTKDMPYGPVKVNGEPLEYGLRFVVLAQEGLSRLPFSIEALIFVYSLMLSLIISALVF